MKDYLLSRTFTRYKREKGEEKGSNLFPEPCHRQAHAVRAFHGLTANGDLVSLKSEHVFRLKVDFRKRDHHVFVVDAVLSRQSECRYPRKEGEREGGDDNAHTDERTNVLSCKLNAPPIITARDRLMRMNDG